MKSMLLKKICLPVLASTLLLACERDYDITVKDGQQQLIVEGYINNEFPLYNYVVLSRSKDFYDPGLENLAVSGATVSITEGERVSGDIQWDEATRTVLTEGRLPQLANSALPGFYFDQRLRYDSLNALVGKPGKCYKLTIEVEGKQYSAITQLPVPVAIDTLTCGFYYTDSNADTTYSKARITVNYKDPDTIGNTQLFFWRHWDNRKSFGWGALGTNRFASGADDLVNGQQIAFTQSYGFVLGDSVSIYMASVERPVYNFWDSFNKARSNDGPFATPVTLQSTIQGELVTGCFSGFSVSVKSVVVQ
ncbi:DUF4249 domain-containing protein [Paraflavitalea pollutisoli]|uniref:DUF4249 domain-containing protein n=1 Tax=Paraflavitalea pollutisoli TaxID=3034143 RepID=UPI0023ED207A|nr:DUF4249 domain-containing protein [Paraflavitalea sp. H1-2-19X]